MNSHRLTAIFSIVVVLFTVACTSSTIDSSPAPSDTPMSTPSSPVSSSLSPTATASPAPSKVPPSVTATGPPSATGIPTPRQPTATVAITMTASTTPMEPSSTSQPTPTCEVVPEGVFLTIWESQPDFRAALHCPISYHPRIEPAAWDVETAYQPFEHGAMVWSNKIGWFAQPVIYVLYNDGTFRRFEDTFDRANDPVEGEETPPQGLYEPILGFGKVWREQPGVREALGWATDEEIPGAGRFQIFEGGAMVWLSQHGETCVFFDDHYAIVGSPSFH